MDAYGDELQRIQDLELAYPCFCTRKEIQAETERILGAPHGDTAPLYPGTCRNLDNLETAARIAAGEPHSWRLDSTKAADFHGELTFSDTRFGISSVDVIANGDVVLARKDIGTSYHLAVVVDDEFQQITHVTRGEDLLGATHVQRQLQAILGYREPTYLHHGLVRDKKGIRLAKRDAAKSIGSLRESGHSAVEILKMAKESVS